LDLDFECGGDFLIGRARLFLILEGSDLLRTKILLLFLGIDHLLLLGEIGIRLLFVILELLLILGVENLITFFEGIIEFCQ
jgi:hypothetical protein